MMFDACHIFQDGETTSIDALDQVSAMSPDGVAGFTCSEFGEDVEFCGLCRRGICVQTVRSALDGATTVIHGSWLA